MSLETDNKPFGCTPAQTVHVDVLVVTAWNAEACQTGRTVEAVVRESLGVLAGPLVVVAVDMTAALEERVRTGEAEPGTPLQELLKAAFVDSLRHPPKRQA